MILVGRQKRSQSDTLLCEHNAVGSRNLILYQDELNTEAVQAGPKKCTTNTRLSFSSKLQADLETLQNLNFLGQVKIGLRLDKIRRHQSFFTVVWKSPFITALNDYKLRASFLHHSYH